MPTTNQRPPAFVYSRNVLHCERVPLTRLAAKFGTPLYVYSGTTIRERFLVFDTAFQGFPHTVCYSVKANPNLSILKLLASLGSGFDVVSGGELERVLLADRKAGARVVFSGVGKTAAEMDLAIRSGILLFNVESAGEMALLAERAARLRRRVRMALRVNPDVPADTHPYIATGLHKHKFGVPMEEATRLYTAAAKERWLDVAGVSVHIGSQITSVEPFSVAMQRVAELVRKLKTSGHDIRYVDAGGGLGIRYQLEPSPNGKRSGKAEKDDFPAQATDYARAVTGPLRQIGVHLLLEPGRSIVAKAGALLVSILYTKQNDHKRFVVVDGAMNDLIRPTLYGAHHDITPVRLKRAKISIVDVVGPICESGDFFARDRELPGVEEGNLLAILDAGAYGASISSNYNTRPRAAEVMVEGARVRVVRKRETIKDLVTKEL
ncbi:MAG: diaminopimelate decarboxylase [Candidatus Korobacteraceae bacterium]